MKEQKWYFYSPSNAQKTPDCETTAISGKVLPRRRGKSCSTLYPHLPRNLKIRSEVLLAINGTRILDEDVRYLGRSKKLLERLPKRIREQAEMDGETWCAFVFKTGEFLFVHDDCVTLAKHLE